jgi:membrane-associated phospholipid phosphatase
MLLDTLSDLVLGVYLVIFAVLAWRGERLRVVLAVVLTALAYAGNEVLKVQVHEARPCTGMPGCPDDSSFPSGHAVIAGAATMAVLLLNRGFRWLAIVTAAFVAVSRVVLGVHFVHDVVGGLLLGALVMSALLLKVTSRQSVQQNSRP